MGYTRFRLILAHFEASKIMEDQAILSSFIFQFFEIYRCFKGVSIKKGIIMDFMDYVCPSPVMS